MPKRRKKYNPIKNAQRIASNILRNTAIIFTTGGEPCKLIDTRTHKLLPINKVVQGSIENFPYAWLVHIATFGKDASGKPYMKSEVIEAQAPYYQADMVDSLNKHHALLNKSMNQNQFIGCGWIASPHGEEFSEKEAFAMFESIGAFDRERREDGIYVTETEAA